jgi:hypothetical protein
VAVVVGLAGLDDEQIALGVSDDFWRLILARRQEPSITRSELERRLSEADKAT